MAAQENHASARPLEQSLSSFLESYGLGAVIEPALADCTLEDIASRFFGEGRIAFFSWLAQRGVALPERQVRYTSQHWMRTLPPVLASVHIPSCVQKLANALSKASRGGVSGVAESPEAVVAWMDGNGSATGPAVWTSSRRFLVFTSAGDDGNVPLWVRNSGAERAFDLCVVYYGNEADPPCLRIADCCMRNRGGKFPNLLHMMKAQLSYVRSFEVRKHFC